MKDGTYELNRGMFITGNNIVVKGYSGDREKIILKGQGMEGSLTHIFHIQSNNITIANMMLGWVKHHGVQVHRENGTKDTLIHNVSFIDIGQQMLKVSSDHQHKTRAEEGIVQWCKFEFSKGIASQYYTGGIDAHYAKNWVIRNNIFYGIRSPDHRQAEHAIHFWSESENTLVEKNIIANTDRGIGFGFPEIGKHKFGGHKGGVIRNNMIHTNRDVGIGLERSPNTKVYHNTLYTENYSNSIEYRFTETTGVMIVNNLSNKSIKKRNNAEALMQINNITNAHKNWFVDALNGNLHLNAGYSNIIDKAKIMEENIKTDIDCQKRPYGILSDIGTDEYQGEQNTKVKLPVSSGRDHAFML